MAEKNIDNIITMEHSEIEQSITTSIKKMTFEKVTKTSEILIEGNYDVVVIGGGTSGVVAALAAAQNGAKTLVLEKHGFLGGSLLAGAVCFMGFFNVYKAVSNTKEVQLIQGIPEKIVERLIQEGASNGFYEEFAATDYDSKSVSWDHDKLPIVLLNMLKEKNIDVMLGANFEDALMERNTIRGVLYSDKKGQHAVYGKVIIDASGIGEVAYKAGAECTKIRERQTGGMSMGMTGVHIDRFVEYAKKHHAVRLLSYGMNGNEPEKLARITIDLRKIPGIAKLVQNSCFMDSPCMISLEDGAFHMINAVTMNFDTTDPCECQKARITLTNSCLKLANAFREYLPGFEDACLDWVSPDIGIRFGRVVTCEYDITQEDVKNLVIPEDCIGVYGVQDAYLAAGEEYAILGGWYGIPYRAIIPKKIENLLVAGEMITSDWVVWMSIRLTGGCMLTGQAAGTAAALAAKSNISPRDLEYSELEQALICDGVFLGKL